MRILITVIGAIGHIQPMIPLAVALRASGHDVRVATQPGMTHLLDRAGLDTISVGTGQDGPVTPETVAAAVPRDAAQLLSEVADCPPDVVIREWNELVGLSVAVELGLPCVVFGTKIRPPAPDRTQEHPCVAFMQSVMEGRSAPAGDGPQIDLSRLLSRQTRLAKRTGLPASVDLSRLYGDLWLNTHPQSLDVPGTPPLRREYRFRHGVYDQLDDVPAPDWLDEMPADSLVFGSLGTHAGELRPLYQDIVDSFAGLPAQLVLTTGNGADPALFQPTPPNVRVVRWVPNTLMMPRCAAVLCHGGFNTVLAALSHGRPVLSIPLESDQPLNARRCAEQGAGLNYPVPPGGLRGSGGPVRIDPARLGALVTRLLTEPSLGDGARRIAAEMDALPRIDAAVALIEDLVGTGSNA